MICLSQRQVGVCYTPDAVGSNLVRWAARKDSDRLLDPSSPAETGAVPPQPSRRQGEQRLLDPCGDGRFIAAHRNSFGVEQDAEAAAVAMSRVPEASVCVHQDDFFA